METSGLDLEQTALAQRDDLTTLWSRLLAGEEHQPSEPGAISWILSACSSDAHFAVGWQPKRAGTTMFTPPRAAVLRSFVFSHVIHHRGQLTVYLRLCDVLLPSIYGPTADAPF